MNKDFEFTLRRDARFSDGTSVTAGAVVGWLSYFAKANGPFATTFGPNPSFEAVGKWTVRIHVTVPNPSIPYQLSEAGRNWGYVASAKAVTDPSLFATGSYGAGPYMLDPSRTVAGAQYTFVPNPYYYDKSSIKYSEVQVTRIATPSSMLQAVQASQLDVAWGDPTTARAATSAGLSVVWGSGSNIVLALGDRNGSMVKPLADVRVRQAVNYAINRKAIANALLAGYGKPTSGFPVVGVSDPKSDNFYPYDPQRAKSLLAAAGYGGGFTLKVLDLPFGDPTFQAVARDLQAVGIKLDITTAATTGEFLQKLPLFPAFQAGQDALPMPLVYTARLAPGGLQNPFHVNDPVINKLYYTGLRLTDPTNNWKRIVERVVRQAYFAPITTTPVLLYVSKRVGGVSVSKARAATPIPTEWYPK